MLSLPLLFLPSLYSCSLFSISFHFSISFSLSLYSYLFSPFSTLLASSPLVIHFLFLVSLCIYTCVSSRPPSLSLFSFCFAGFILLYCILFCLQMVFSFLFLFFPFHVASLFPYSSLLAISAFVGFVLTLAPVPLWCTVDLLCTLGLLGLGLAHHFQKKQTRATSTTTTLLLLRTTGTTEDTLV